MNNMEKKNTFSLPVALAKQDMHITNICPFQKCLLKWKNAIILYIMDLFRVSFFFFFFSICSFLWRTFLDYANVNTQKKKIALDLRSYQIDRLNKKLKIEKVEDNLEKHTITVFQAQVGRSLWWKAFFWGQWSLI